MSQSFISPSYPQKIVTGSVMASIDHQSIEERGVAGLYLMERAGEGVVSGLLNRHPRQELFQSVVWCGKGNNGGDGFVVARRLAVYGLSPVVAVIGSGNELKGDAATNFKLALQQSIPIWECHTSEDLEKFVNAYPDSKVVVDALLGTGARGAPRGLIAEAIQLINQNANGKFIVSVDIPSGVEGDTGRVEGEVVQADTVYTMGLPKAGHVLPPGMDFFKKLIVLNIGFPLDLLHSTESKAEILTEKQIDAWIPKRNKSAHKGSEGHLLVLSGSKGMTGAALMCAKAAVIMGSGLVTAVCPKSLLPIYAGGVWEMLTIPASETPEGSLAEEAWDDFMSKNVRFSAVLIGPGMGRHPSTAALVQKVVREIKEPVLIDGDGLSALTPDLLAEREFPWVVTPHPGEMARLYETGVPEIQSDRWGYVRKLSNSPHGVAVLKGANTAITSQDAPVYVNPAGTPAMASGGMGDVLAGMIGSLLGRGIQPLHAAAAGVYLHGLAAEIIVGETGAEAVCATQVIEKIQTALFQVRKNSRA